MSRRATLVAVPARRNVLDRDETMATLGKLDHDPHEVGPEGRQTMYERRPAPLPLVGLVLAALLAGCTSHPTPSPPPSATPTAAPRSFAEVGVTAVGNIPQGSTSGATLRLAFTEGGIAVFRDAPGSFRVTLTDHAGVGSTVSFTGNPSTKASPGSLGASASVGGNVLMVDIVASDTQNIEPIIITGLGIDVTPSAAVGTLQAVMSDFTGSLAAGPIVFSTGSPASGTIATGIGAGATSVTVSLDPGSCSFGGGGPLSFRTTVEKLPLLSVAEGPGDGRETLTIGPTSSSHGGGDAVEGARACGVSSILASPGAVEPAP